MLKTKSSMRPGPMWRCPRCRRPFANKNQSHFCGRYTLKAHFAGKPPAVAKLFKQLVAQIQRCGPFILVPEKTRIAFQVRMSFAAVQIQHAKVVGHLVLAERHERSCFVRIDTISRRNHVHHFHIKQPADLNKEFCRFIRKAYKVGQQMHLQA